MTVSTEEKSFENIVRFYAHELKLVQAGGNPFEIFSRRERVRLHRHGVLSYREGHSMIVLTDRAKEILHKISDE